METFARLEWRQPDIETFARLEDLIWRQPDMETFAMLEDLIWRHLLGGKTLYGDICYAGSPDMETT
jgi:hypothetical protein